jgi:multidrug efflux system outer membrane protein
VNLLLVQAACWVALLLSGCEVGPNYQRPDVVKPPQFQSQAPTQPVQAAARVRADWWQLYGDRELNQLEREANANNQNLRQALARVEEAGAQARVAASYLMPTVTLDPQFTRARESGTRVSPITGTPTKAFTFNDYLVPLDLRYEIDVFGRLRRQYETATAQARAAAYDEGFVRLTVDTDVAVYYFAIRSLDAQEQILTDSVKAFTEQVRIVSVQLKNGLVTPVDLYQAEAQLAATIAQQNDVRRARDDEEHALATVCGRPAPLFAVADDPLINPSPPEVPAGLPGQLLVGRPDVAEAEQNLVAANAQIGVAVANFYPTFSLTGEAGFESASAAQVLDWRSVMASIGPSVSMPIFEGGRLRNQLAYARARYSETLGAYLNSVLSAYQDVENALTDLHALTVEVANLQQAVAASQGYVRVSGVQYQRGLTTYLTVIDAERTLLSNRLTLAQTVNQQVAASIHLIQAIGGGWNPKPTP